MTTKREIFEIAERLVSQLPPPADLIEQLEKLRDQLPEDDELRRLFGWYFEAAQALL